jgi:flagellar basal body-associated protein FliL
MKKLGLILGLVNTLVIAGVLGLFVYTKMIYKRPPITEAQQRKRLSSTQQKVEVVHNQKKGIVPLDAITANLDPYTGPDGKQKLHYVSVSLSVEIRDEKEVHKFEEIKPIVLDQILQQLGKKKFEDLNQVQGRYLFRSAIIDATNAYLKEPVITEVYFTDFLLQ